MAPERPNRRAISEWATAALYRAIFSGEIPPGTALVESDLTEMLGVSRSPIREALRELEANGVVVSDAINGRRVVATFGADDVAEVYGLRAALERLAHERAATRLDAGGIREVEAAMQAMEAADPSTSTGRSQQFEADFQFHEAVARGANMPRLITALRGLWTEARALLHQLDAAGVYPSGVEIASVRDDHRAMLDALLRRDPAAAADAVARHLESRAHVLVEAVRAHGGLAADTGSALDGNWLTRSSGKTQGR